MHLVYQKKQTNKQTKQNVLNHCFRFLSGRPLETVAMQIFSGRRGGGGRGWGGEGQARCSMVYLKMVLTPATQAIALKRAKPIHSKKVCQKTLFEASQLFLRHYLAKSKPQVKDQDGFRSW